MELKKAIIFVCVFFVAAIAITAAAYSLFVVVEVHTFPMNIVVEDVVGVNVDNDMFYFGSMPPTNASLANRNAIYVNNNDFEVEVSAFFSGEMKEWTYVENNNLRLYPGESGKLVYYVQLNDGVEYGNYSGTAKMYVKRVLW
ncbi:hypothetical protein CL619_03670 [archaeon]|nr:hypothetical protein [archaeon]